MVPQSNTQVYLAAIAGDFNGELPAPQSAVQAYLFKIANNAKNKEAITAERETEAEKSISVNISKSPNNAVTVYKIGESIRMLAIDFETSSDIDANITKTFTVPFKVQSTITFPLCNGKGDHCGVIQFLQNTGNVYLMAGSSGIKSGRVMGTCIVPIVTG